MNRGILLCVLCVFLISGACAGRNERRPDRHKEDAIELIRPDEDPWHRPALEPEDERFGI